MDVLFLCKQGSDYGSGYKFDRKWSGLYNSTQFIVKALNEKDFNTDIQTVIDGNKIDSVVTHFRPSIVVVEALWVTPQKFVELQARHPKVKWLVHLHSNIPFLSNEGIAMEWLKAYAKIGIGVITNSEEAFDSIRTFFPRNAIWFLPNVYNIDKRIYRPYDDKKLWIDICCFGAIRPMKNQLTQAIAAIAFAQSMGKELRFHINAKRVEQRGEPILKNLIKLFDATPNAQLILHDWYAPEEFINILTTMDIGMQVSLSETFNVVTADYISAALPIVVSDQINWVSTFCWADPNSALDIFRVMRFVFRSHFLVTWNQILLKQFARKSIRLWTDFCKELLP